MIENIKIIFIKLLLLKFNTFKINLNKKRGFKAILKNKNLVLLRKIKSQMLDIDFSNEFYSQFDKSNQLNISLIQYLNDYFIYPNSNFIQLLFYYFGKKKIFVFPLPKKWIEILKKNGIKVSNIRSRFLWSAYVLLQYSKGLFLFFKINFLIILRKIKIFIFKDYKKIFDFKNKNYSIFVGDTAKDLGFQIDHDRKLIKKVEIPNLVDWYQQNNPDEFIITSSKYNEGNNYFEKHAFLKNNYDFLLDDINIFLLIIAFLKIQTKIFLNLFIFKWGYALLHEELIVSEVFKLLKKPPKNIFFYWYANTYKPLWAIELEKKNCKTQIYLKGSINNISENKRNFKINENRDDYDSIGFKIDRWKNYLIWHPAIENVLRQNIKSINKVTCIKINPYEGYFHEPNLKRKIAIPKKSVSVFPFSKVKTHYGITALNDYFYSDADLLEKFLDDIYEILISNDITMVLKMKKKKFTEEYKRDIKVFEKFKKKEKVIFLSSELPVYDIVNLTMGSISVPFSSTALIAKKINKPSIYYDPKSFVSLDDVFSSGIEIFSSKKELSNFIENLRK